MLPLRWADDTGLAELTAYLDALPPYVRPIVVDGSPEPLFAAHASAWADSPVAHVSPAVRCANGKVAGVLTGMVYARSEVVVLADDDVRYDAESLARLLAAMPGNDLVVPQNVFRPVPWHARWDTARSLLNRCLGADHPGTMAVRRDTFVAMGGYRGDVLFENLELVRTVRAYGGRVRRARDVYVVRRPPTVRHFAQQRLRQAYDDLAQPARLVAELAIVPSMLLARRRPVALAVAGAGAVALAEAGRRRAGGRLQFPAAASLFAPAWLVERGVCVWIAVALRVLCGGMPYAGARLARAATPPRVLRRAQRARRVGCSVAVLDAVRGVPGGESGRGVAPVAERLDG